MASGGLGIGGERFPTLSLGSEYEYNEYLGYERIEDLLEKLYKRLTPGPPINDVFERIQSGKGGGHAGETIEMRPTKPDTAFVLMAIDPKKPELEDVYQTIKGVFRDFKINAYRSTDVEHQDRITDLALQEITTCEFLIADLTYERPNVYYEVGYAHALKKKPILYRRTGTRLHFDLSVHNVPEYENLTELTEKLRARLEAILGRQGKKAD